MGKSASPLSYTVHITEVSEEENVQSTPPWLLGTPGCLWLHNAAAELCSQSKVSGSLEGVQWQGHLLLFLRHSVARHVGDCAANDPPLCFPPESRFTLLESFWKHIMLLLLPLKFSSHLSCSQFYCAGSVWTCLTRGMPSIWGRF